MLLRCARRLGASRLWRRVLRAVSRRTMLGGIGSMRPRLPRPAVRPSLVRSAARNPVAAKQAPAASELRPWRSVLGGRAGGRSNSGPCRTLDPVGGRGADMLRPAVAYWSLGKSGLGVCECLCAGDFALESAGPRVRFPHSALDESAPRLDCGGRSCTLGPILGPGASNAQTGRSLACADAPRLGRSRVGRPLRSAWPRRGCTGSIGPREAGQALWCGYRLCGARLDRAERRQKQQKRPVPARPACGSEPPERRGRPRLCTLARRAAARPAAASTPPSCSTPSRASSAGRSGRRE